MSRLTVEAPKEYIILSSYIETTYAFVVINPSLRGPSKFRRSQAIMMHTPIHKCAAGGTRGIGVQGAIGPASNLNDTHKEDERVDDGGISATVQPTAVYLAIKIFFRLLRILVHKQHEHVAMIGFGTSL